MTRIIVLLAALLLSTVAQAQTTVRPCITTGTNTCPPVSSDNPMPISGSITVAFSTIGSAVPSTGLYNGINVAGTLRGWTGVNPSGSIYAAQIDLASVAGATVATGNGTASGAIRVALPTDGTGVVGLIAGSAIVGKVGIDQTTPGTTNAVSLAQIGGTTTATGNGVVGAGVQRVSIASDNTAFSVNATLQAGSAAIGNLASQYPGGATPYTASATGTTGATTATLTGASSVTTYICGFSIRANATAAATNNATVTGTITGTLNFTQWTAPLASGLGLTEMIFTPCVPASATNTSVAVVSGAPGSGGVVSVSAWGYKL